MAAGKFALNISLDFQGPKAITRLLNTGFHLLPGSLFINVDCSFSTRMSGVPRPRLKLDQMIFSISRDIKRSTPRSSPRFSHRHSSSNNNADERSTIARGAGADPPQLDACRILPGCSLANNYKD